LPPISKPRLRVRGKRGSSAGSVEHLGVVADRLENLAHAVGDPRRVMARTDCGRPGSGPVTKDLEWPKLAAMAEGAGIASQRLF